MATFLVNHDIIEYTVNGVQVGQDIKNVLHYRFESLVAGDITLENTLDSFQDWWQSQVLALISDSLEVTSYVAKRIGSLIGPQSQPRQRYNAYAEVAGALPADAGQVAGAFLPTYVAVSGKKKTDGPGETFYPAGNPTALVMNAEKFFRGGIRIGGIVELDTEAAQGNDLTVAAATAWQQNLTDLISFAVVGGGGGIGAMKMCVVSAAADGLARQIAAGPANTFTPAYQMVDSIPLNPFVGSQLSRKQRVGGS